MVIPPLAVNEVNLSARDSEERPTNGRAEGERFEKSPTETRDAPKVWRGATEESGAKPTARR
jgi:hypothetical protein